MLKRLVLLMLLVAVSFQMAWAVPTGSYCQHEQGAAAKHFGHHVHQHQNDGKFHGKVPGGVDGDCATCHASCSSIVLPSSSLDVSALGAQSPIVSWQFGNIPAPPAEQPERPNWIRLA